VNSCSEVITSCGTSGKVKKMRKCAQLRLALCSSHQKYQNYKTRSVFWVMPTISKRTIINNMSLIVKSKSSAHCGMSALRRDHDAGTETWNTTEAFLVHIIKTNLMHCLSSVYFVNQPLQVSGLFVAHHQDIYSVPPDDGLQIRQKHVQVDWRNKLRINGASSWFLLHR